MLISCDTFRGLSIIKCNGSSRCTVDSIVNQSQDYVINFIGSPMWLILNAYIVQPPYNLYSDQVKYSTSLNGFCVGATISDV